MQHPNTPRRRATQAGTSARSNSPAKPDSPAAAENPATPWWQNSITPLLTDHDLEQITGRSRSAFQKDRLYDEGPRFIRVGRLIRYRWSDVQEWMDARSDPAPADTNATIKTEPRRHAEPASHRT
jgi:predicted DNA-binding transcriptional regulator AlpA